MRRTYKLSSKGKKISKFGKRVREQPNIKEIFNYKTKIIYLSKFELDIFYSYYHKYPLLVREKIHKNTGTFKDKFNTDNFNTFNLDKNIPSKNQLKIIDYQNYMSYGGSYGHNAPAAYHRTNPTIYKNTYLLSNICPQEIVFNSGLWVLLENWIKILKFHSRLVKRNVFTGSIPDTKLTKFNKSEINVPTHMFKLLVFQHLDVPNTLFVSGFIMKNKPVYYNNISKIDFKKYLVDLDAINTKTNINFEYILRYYNLLKDGMVIKPITIVLETIFNLNDLLKIQLKKSKWYGKLIYSKNLNELDKNWKQLQKFEDEFKSLTYHEEYYNYAKKKLSNQ